MKRESYFYLLLFLLGVFLLIVGLDKFYSGIHDMDLSQNYERIAHTFNISLEEFVEKDTRDKDYTVEELYLKGMKNLIQSRIFLVVSGLFIATGVILLFIKH